MSTIYLKILVYLLVFNVFVIYLYAHVKEYKKIVHIISYLVIIVLCFWLKVYALSDFQGTIFVTLERKIG
jgi:hypothetical protein